MKGSIEFFQTFFLVKKLNEVLAIDQQLEHLHHAFEYHSIYPADCFRAIQLLQSFNGSLDSIIKLSSSDGNSFILEYDNQPSYNLLKKIYYLKEDCTSLKTLLYKFHPICFASHVEKYRVHGHICEKFHALHENINELKSKLISMKNTNVNGNNARLN